MGGGCELQMNHKVLKTAICLSWIILVICFIVKAFGGNFFDIVDKSTWLEDHEIYSVIIFSCTSYIMFTVYYMAIAEVSHFKIWIHIVLLPYFIGISLLKVLVLGTEYHIFLDIFSNFIIPALLILYVANKPKIKSIKKMIRIAIAFALNCGFQSISVLVRGLPTGVVVSNMLTQLIMSLDVLIMLVLYWLYSLYYKEIGGEKE